MDDAGIIELFFARDEGAVSRCREKYGAYLRAVARNVTGSEPGRSGGMRRQAAA